MTKKKKVSQREHFKKRMLERFNIDISRKRYDELVSMIKSKDAVLLERQSLRVSKYKITIDSKDYIVIYDKQRKTLVTVLPQ
jgi:hypothetical protein